MRLLGRLYDLWTKSSLQLISVDVPLISSGGGRHDNFVQSQKDGRRYTMNCFHLTSVTCWARRTTYDRKTKPFIKKVAHLIKSYVIHRSTFGRSGTYVFLRVVEFYEKGGRVG